jgi:YidC/Oxa1 family membrane protein insertase
MNMDRKTAIIVAICVAFLFFYRPLLKLAGLDHYIEPPRQTVPATPARPDTASAPADEIAAPPPTAVTPAPRSPGFEATPIRTAEPVLERSESIETPLYRANFSNRGARLVSIELKQYASSRPIAGDGKRVVTRPGQTVPEGHRVTLSGGPLFGIDLGSGNNLRPLADAVYAVEDSVDAAGERRVLHFTLRDSAGMQIRQTYRVRPDDYGIELEVAIQNPPAGVTEYSLTTRSWPLLTEADQAADERSLKATSFVGSNIHREGSGGLNKAPKPFMGNAQWAIVQTRYFIAGPTVRSGAARGVISSGARRVLSERELAVLPRGTRPEQPVVANALVMGLNEARPDRFLVYAGPSEHKRLSKLGVGLERTIDLGWNWVRPFSALLLEVLLWLHAVVRNYGVAILLLATLVRVLLHPLNMISMKSMRSMQRVQPEMERIREKYKSDPQAMNTAVMALYKENKINPAGGCLPLLLQMPLFLALYQVLFNAIELRQAPFMLWMNDLSAPDELFSVAGFPIRLLPLLMTVSGYLQMKMTPTDPRQAPTMYMMNAVMLVFFYNLPSGLVLYWTVMNLLTAFQQWMMLRNEDPLPSAAVVVQEKPKKSKRG